MHSITLFENHVKSSAREIKEGIKKVKRVHRKRPAQKRLDRQTKKSLVSRKLKPRRV